MVRSYWRSRRSASLLLDTVIRAGSKSSTWRDTSLLWRRLASGPTGYRLIGAVLLGRARS